MQNLLRNKPHLLGDLLKNRIALDDRHLGFDVIRLGPCEVLCIQPFKRGGLLNLNQANGGIKGGRFLENGERGAEKSQEKGDEKDHQFS